MWCLNPANVFASWILLYMHQIQALLGQQNHKIAHRVAINWSNIPAFYKTICQKTAITTPAFAFTYSVTTWP
ncbi:hypothetical protein CEV08_03705 [Bartonella tribocorum]|uniref:Uncharacterized protein n=1 Tax=Bartonella tribocorum TaxID=85701 RepID=A0A2M6UWI5_9HYPH|nr:hypothetical protein CEV08_03705 [Bartonella tribocorum]